MEKSRSDKFVWTSEQMVLEERGGAPQPHTEPPEPEKLGSGETPPSLRTGEKQGSWVTIEDQPIFVGGPGQGAGGAGGGGGGEPLYQVGITSARPGKEIEQIMEEMDEFESMMEETPVEDLEVELGTGGWEGGEEPTFITSYKGNDEAKAMLARAGKKWNQSGVLVMKQVSEGGQPQSRISFDFNLSGEQMQEIQDSMVRAGLGGWTWGKTERGSMLMATCIPQWGGDADAHRAGMNSVLNGIRASGMNASLDESRVEVTTMDRGSYDEFIP